MPAAGKPRFELVKIVAHSVTIERDGDRIAREIDGPAHSLYSSEELAAFYDKCVAELADASVAAAAAEKPANRKARRAAPKTKPEAEVE